MRTVYGSTEKLYPSLPSAPPLDESHIGRLKKVEEIEAFLRNEILERERLYTLFFYKNILNRAWHHVLNNYKF